MLVAIDLVNSTSPSANMPEKTMPSTVSLLMRLLDLSQFEPQAQQNSPARRRR